MIMKFGTCPRAAARATACQTADPAYPRLTPSLGRAVKENLPVAKVASEEKESGLVFVKES